MNPAGLLRPEDPRQIGDYGLLSRLGTGAMGTVYLGRSRGGRPVAVKVARPELAEDPNFRERFRREVDMARSVGGFWTAAVVDADPAAPCPWLATEYVAGPSLQHAVATHGPLPEPAVRRLAAGLAEAIAAIHQAGLVHRDLKPSNVLLATDGPRVIDFGISRALEGSKLTATGTFFGTPGFLSPEQITGEPVGPASDVFALGAVLVYAAGGDGPFGDGDTAGLVYRAVHGEPELGKVPPGLRPILSACLHSDPAQRPTPTRLLSWIGAVEVAAAPSGQWLPDSVQTLVNRYRTELGQSAPDQSTPGQPAPGTAVLAEPPGTGHGIVRFTTSRSSAVGWASLTGMGGLVTLGMSSPDSGWPQGVRVLALIGAIVFIVTTVRLLVAAGRSIRSLEIDDEGVVVTKDRQRWRLPWYGISRVRVVGSKSKPWLVVWFNEQYQGKAMNVFDRHHGGVRVFPIGHEYLPRNRRATEVSEIRAALAWHAPQVFDPSP